jgi:hypothetical protein
MSSDLATEQIRQRLIDTLAQALAESSAGTSNPPNAK